MVVERMVLSVIDQLNQFMWFIFKRLTSIIWLIYTFLKNEAVQNEFLRFPFYANAHLWNEKKIICTCITCVLGAINWSENSDSGFVCRLDKIQLIKVSMPIVKCKFYCYSRGLSLIRIHLFTSFSNINGNASHCIT